MMMMMMMMMMTTMSMRARSNKLILSKIKCNELG